MLPLLSNTSRRALTSLAILSVQVRILSRNGRVVGLRRRFSQDRHGPHGTSGVSTASEAGADARGQGSRDCRTGRPPEVDVAGIIQALRDDTYACHPTDPFYYPPDPAHRPLDAVQMLEQLDPQLVIAELRSRSSPGQRSDLLRACLAFLHRKRIGCSILTATLRAPGDLTMAARRAVETAGRREEQGIAVVGRLALDLLDEDGTMSSAAGWRWRAQAAVRAAINELQPRTATPLLELDNQEAVPGPGARHTEHAQRAAGIAFVDALAVYATLHGVQWEWGAERKLQQYLRVAESLLRNKDMGLAAGTVLVLGRRDEFGRVFSYGADGFRTHGRFFVHHDWMYFSCNSSRVANDAAFNLGVHLQRNPHLTGQLQGPYPVTSNVRDRHGSGVYYALTARQAFTLAPASSPRGIRCDDEVIIIEAAFQDSLAQLLLLASDWLGPKTTAQYCFAVRIRPDRQQFRASLFVFRKTAENNMTGDWQQINWRESFLDFSPPIRSSAHFTDISADDANCSAGYNVAGYHLTEDTAQRLLSQKEELLRVLDMELLHRWDMNDANADSLSVAFDIDLKYPDGQEQTHAVDLGLFGRRLKNHWLFHWELLDTPPESLRLSPFYAFDKSFYPERLERR
ncbi:uncharacterized protein LOC129587384 isoform X2 [Paramacrobiotus metropolitanus]|uniref:uncharacterized protein LOC129587384 isoform X2 n=1 Tax=Paramacrobiotus metropolitanus TaxID=2943436 RepID=UPI002445DCBB|nr:uncharacterized protein LOC129587384 isoform X2 [Paramacrobiotus metropolitanus]